MENILQWDECQVAITYPGLILVKFALPSVLMLEKAASSSGVKAGRGLGTFCLGTRAFFLLSPENSIELDQDPGE